MKLKTTIFISFIYTNLICQSIITGTSIESNENVNSSNYTTKIKLFSLELNGLEIPISISYNHSGVKQNESNTSLGIKWKFDEIGHIERIVNHRLDKIDDWNSANSVDFSSSYTDGICLDECNISSIINSSNDLTPDFYILKNSNGLSCDFIHSKSDGNSISKAVILTNNNGIKINTDFSVRDSLTNHNDISFNVIDNKGYLYNYINGPQLQDFNRFGSLSKRNNFYLNKISDLNNVKSININYIENNLYKEVYYQVGFIGVGNSDYDNNIIPIQNVDSDYFLADESRYDISSINCEYANIIFVYQGNFIKEINVYDLSGNYLFGFLFNYSNSLLRSIERYSKNKTEKYVEYLFEYFNEEDAGIQQEVNGNYEDYFGYNNGVNNTNFLPFQIRNLNGTITPAGNLTPNINFAKSLSLKKITNKYGGYTEFDYLLNSENHSYYGNIYGGGLVLKSKKISDNNGLTTYIKYDYENLTGFVILTSDLAFQYFTNGYQNSKNYSNIPNLFEIDDIESNYILSNIHSQGNFFAKVTETIYDFDLMEEKSKIVSTYITNSEGVFRTPMLRKQEYFDNNLLKKVVENEYESNNYDIIQSAKFRFDQRSFYWAKRISYSPIFVNSIKIKRKKVIDLNFNEIQNVSEYTYVNSKSNILRSITQSSSDNFNQKKIEYYYSEDVAQLSIFQEDPFLVELFNKNVVGLPIVTRELNNNIQTYITQTVYSKDLSTSNLLMPKHIISKKGSSSEHTYTHKTFTFDLYDNKGNLLQLTEGEGMKTSFIWGYQQTKPIATLKNLNYSQIPLNIIQNLQNKSNIDFDNCNISSCVENSLRNDLNQLRASFPQSMINTKTYDYFIGETSLTDEKGEQIIFEYDIFNRLKLVRDRNNKILSEREYKYFTQN